MHALQQTVVLDAIVKASLILAATGLVTLVLRRASAAARHMIWTLGLMGALIVPALALALPRWEVPLVRISADAIAAQPPAAMPAPVTPAVAHHRTATNDAAAGPAVSAAATTTTGSEATTARTLPSWSTSLLLIWSIGALLIIGRMMLGLVAVQWMSRRTALVTEAPWLAQANRWQAISASRVFDFFAPERPRCRWPGASCVRRC